MIVRIDYLKQLIAHKDKKEIKIITGVRGCGKSVFLEQFRKILTSKGIEERFTQLIPMEDPEFANLRNCKSLFQHVVSRLQKEGMNYIIIDEVQLCPDFHKVIFNLFNMENTDIYISGSNISVVSEKLLAAIKEKSYIMRMMPFSFGEYLEEKKQLLHKGSISELNLLNSFQDYSKYGNFPFTVQLARNSRNISHYLTGLYNTVIVKDIASRHPIKEINVLDSAIKFMLKNIGCSVSSKKLSDILTMVGIKTTQPTAENYLKYLEECFLFYKVDRYDIKNKEHLKSLSKYYTADIGISNLLTTKTDMNTILRNLVFLELKKQDYEIYAGKIGSHEIDFMAVRNGETRYIQVESFAKDNKALDKRLRSFKMIKDYYPRILISLDKPEGLEASGIKSVNALDFLRNGQL